jgi:glycerol-3-phosphate dehydrogenase
LVQGAHLLLPDQKLRGIYYVEARNDQRGIFVMPWREQTLIGTTETAFTGDPATVEPTTEEVDYLLATARHHFPDAPFYRKHLTGQFAGLRVLPAGEGAFFRRPRETQMPVDRETQPRLLSLVGGKLTNYRATAEKCVAKLSDSLPARKAIAKTSELELSLSD